MQNNYFEQLEQLILQNPHLQKINLILKQEHLRNATICAGAIRNLVWDKKHQLPSSLLQRNIDIYYQNASESEEDFIVRQTTLNQKYPTYLWNLHNIALQPRRARNQGFYGKTMRETISNFPETATAVGVSFDPTNNLEIIAPYGLDDLFELVVKPTPNFTNMTPNNHAAYLKRLNRKNWSQRWDQLQIKQ